MYDYEGDMFSYPGKTVCFSGHRPESLPDGGNPQSLVTGYIKKLINDEIVESLSDGYNTFIVGGARGIDLWAAEELLALRDDGYDLNIIVSVPYRGFGSRYYGHDAVIMHRSIECAEKVICIAESYFNGCMFRRNEYMVDHSSKLIAFVNDYRSGTGQTIRYAKKKNIITKIYSLPEIADYVVNSYAQLQ